jgi:hypothetical protein
VALAVTLYNYLSIDEGVSYLLICALIVIAMNWSVRCRVCLRMWMHVSACKSRPVQWLRIEPTHVLHHYPSTVGYTCHSKDFAKSTPYYILPVLSAHIALSCLAALIGLQLDS